ncbi:chemotaxis protein CheW [Geobacter sp. OR-1]|uniref:chemotaxis protein CheW n=1 Tax=Geobacter sp. OR-1 TaxID=1266765 RepID=UPI0005421D0F|nr:chemotaxis protein CheW [Geobacter sp. OR-1]GAM08817.1 chemotaxis protein CheW [Geobacter sp. OR-1]
MEITGTVQNPAEQKLGLTTLQMVSFTVGDEEFCVDILKVQEIIRMVKITHMPNAPEYVEGIINLRNKVIPVIDFRKKMHFSGGTALNEQERRIVVVSFGKTLVGLIVDKVSQVMKISPDHITSTPEVIKGYDSECLMGIGRVNEKLIVLLDLDKMFRQEDMETLPQAA